VTNFSPEMHSKCIPLSPGVLRFGGDTQRSSACGERKRRERCPRFSAFAFAASEDEKETGQRNFGETVVVVTGCLGFIGSNLVSHLLERRNNRSQDDDVHENVIIIGIDVLDVEKGPYKKEDKRENLNRLMHIGKRRFVFIDRDMADVCVRGSRKRCGGKTGRRAKRSTFREAKR